MNIGGLRVGRGNKDVKQKVRDSAAKQNSDSYLASENIKRETSAEEAEEAREGIEEMSKACREKVGEVVFAGGVSPCCNSAADYRRSIHQRIPKA